MATSPENISPRSENPNNANEAVSSMSVPMSIENRTSFNEMSPGGKGIASRIYEGLYKIPGISQIVGKMEIAYNQYWADKHEKKAAELKGEMDADNMRVGVLDQSKAEIESFIESLKQQNMPGTESLQIKLKEIERQKMEILNKKDESQSKFEAKDSKVKLYTNKRDAIADRLIGHYDEKIHPMEKELERLQTCKDRLELETAVMNARHDELSNKMQEAEQRKAKLEEIYRTIGYSDKEIKKDGTISMLAGQLVQGRERIRMDKEILAGRRDEINKKIAKVDAKANPYRDKREKFARVKEGRPLNMEVATRERGTVFEGDETINVRTREWKGGASVEASAEEGFEKRPNVKVLIFGWNEYLKKKFGKATKSLVDQADFLKVTKLRENSDMSQENFKKILKAYYKFKKVSINDFKGATDAFFEEIKNKPSQPEEQLKGEDNEEERLDQEVARRQAAKEAANSASQPEEQLKGEDNEEERLDQEMARRQAEKEADVTAQQPEEQVKVEDNDEESYDQYVASQEGKKTA
ncbi:MAG: hypothetical protein WC120_01185 [Parcubacteria group bacterium]